MNHRHRGRCAYCMSPPATRTENTAEHATARADAAAPAAAPVTGAGAGGTPASVSCADAAANSTAATATSSNAARDAIASGDREVHEAEGWLAAAKLSEAEAGRGRRSGGGED